jgi:replicative DNA helicase
MRKTHKKTQNDSSLYGIPPQNTEAETALLSAILIDDRVLNEVAELLAPSDFYRSAHQKILSAMIELSENQEPIDLVTLTNRLRDKGELDNVGGATYLAQLIDAVPLAINAGHYAKIVHDKAVLRRLIENGYAIVKSCFTDQENVDELIDYAESCMRRRYTSTIRRTTPP